MYIGALNDLFIEHGVLSQQTDMYMSGYKYEYLSMCVHVCVCVCACVLYMCTCTSM